MWVVLAVVERHAKTAKGKNKRVRLRKIAIPEPIF